MFKRSKAYFLRDDASLDSQAQARIGEVLGRSEAMRTAYEYRQRLQAIWQETTAQPDKARQAIQQWCREAEASGNRYLQRFARQLLPG